MNEQMDQRCLRPGAASSNLHVENYQSGLFRSSSSLLILYRQHEESKINRQAYSRLTYALN